MGKTKKTKPVKTKGPKPNLGVAVPKLPVIQVPVPGDKK